MNLKPLSIIALCASLAACTGQSASTTTQIGTALQAITAGAMCVKTVTGAVQVVGNTGSDAVVDDLNKAIAAGGALMTDPNCGKAVAADTTLLNQALNAASITTPPAPVVVKVGG